MGRQYVNNRDLLTEIHKSKNSYCSYIDPAYEDFDLIVSDISEVTEPGVRYRVMCSDHIPDHVTGKGKASKSPTLKGKVKVLFPPFKHYVVKDGKPFEVGRSHWSGGLTQGEFRQDHGRLTSKLGRMFLMMVREYSKKPNWRNYSYLDEMQAAALVQLSAEGLKFDESRGSNPFAYFTQVITNAFIKLQKAEKRTQELRDDLRAAVGLKTSLTHQMASEERER